MRLILTFFLLLVACGEAEPAGFCPIEQASFPPPAPTELDLLLVVDNSNSMAGEQLRFAAELPRMIEALASGDLDADGLADFTPIESLHVGVVSTDMGSGPDLPPGMVVPSCRDGLGDDGILRTLGATSTDGCVATYPPIFHFAAGVDDPATFARDVACVAVMGTGGCGFEQQLEALLKAVAPSVETADYVPRDYVHVDPADPVVNRPPIFAGGFPGHGDRENRGFLRRNSVLAMLLLTDEEDCSVPDYSIFYRDDRYTSVGLSFRCFAFPEALYPTRRYVENFLALREDPGRLVYTGIVGVPVDLVGETYDTILADPRMIPSIDPATTRLALSCVGSDGGGAFPPTRMVEVARGLAERGAHTTMESICAETYQPAVDHILEQIAAPFVARCTERTLATRADGTAACTLDEVLRPGDRCIDVPGTTLVAIETDPFGDVHEVCGLAQVTPADGALDVALGWWLDASDDAARSCNETRQRVRFSGGHRPPVGAEVRVDCEAEVFATTPLHAWCDIADGPGFGNPCELVPVPSGAPDMHLTCDDVSGGCEVACTSTADCAAAGLPSAYCELRSARLLTEVPWAPDAPYGFCMEACE